MTAAVKVGLGKSGATRFLACIEDEVTRETVSRAAAHLGWSDAKVRAGGIAAALRAVDGQSPPRLLLVDTSETAEPAAAVADLIALCGHATRILAIGAINDIALYRELIAMGVADYLVKPVSSELLGAALTAALKLEEGGSGGAGQTRLVAFVGARGGVGTTTLAAGAGWLLHHELKLRTAVVDLDLHFGNLALSLDLEPGRGLREALEHPERTDSLLLASAMVNDADKVPILAGEEPLEEMFDFDTGAVTPLLTALSQDYSCLVVDVPRALNGICRQVLAVADTVVIVADLSLTALRDTLRLLDLTRSLDCRTRPLLVANQVGASHRGEIGRAEFERGLGSPLDFAIPFDAKAAIAVARNGKPLPAAAAGSKATAELRGLAGRISGRQQKARTGLRRWFG